MLHETLSTSWHQELYRSIIKQRDIRNELMLELTMLMLAMRTC